MRRSLLSASLIMLAAAAVFASSLDAISPEMKAQTVDALAKAMKDEYVFPDKAKQVDAMLRKHLADHDYDSVTDGEAFAKLLSEQMREICKDAHLNVRYFPSVLPERKAAAEPSALEIKRAKEMDRYSNAAFQKVERLDGNIGYIQFRNFMDVNEAKRPVKAAFEFLQNTDALIFDLRQNGGGSPETVQLICSYLFGGAPVHLNDLVSRDGSRQEFWTLKKVDGPKYLDRDVYVLVSKRTGSAAEEFTYNLKNLKRATILGESTWGGANPGGTVRLNDHLAAFIPGARAENPITKTNWEGTGVQPDITLDPKDALTAAHAMALKKILATTTDPDRKNMLGQIIADLEAKKG